MAAEVGRGPRHDDHVAGARDDVVVAARAHVALRRLVGLDPPDLDVGQVGVEATHPKKAQSTRASATRRPTATKT
jgi:hypothetical protein